VRPPSVSAECQAQVDARVEASVECEPPRLDFGADTSAIENISEISYYLGEVIAASTEADVILDQLGVFIAEFNGTIRALINGEANATQIICWITNLDAAVAALNAAQGAINTVIAVDVELMTCG